MIERITIIGTGLIGASVGLALKEAGFNGQIVGWDKRKEESQIALDRGALTDVTDDPDDSAYESDVILLATPVMAILDWMERLVHGVSVGQLLTDVGSTKKEITAAAERLYPQKESGATYQNGRFLPGHPMAGKESGGAAIADAALFRDSMWLFTPSYANGSQPGSSNSEVETEWRGWVAKFGARSMDMRAEDHDQICAWVSHLPQMLSTALAALLEDTFSDDSEKMAAVQAIGGRALRETTRLGSSPYSMWRDVALTNTEPIAASLHALEQRLAHLRENLRTPELREEFRTANRFRAEKKA